MRHGFRGQLDAHQKVIDGIQQVRALVDAKWAEGQAVGFAKGEMVGKAAVVLAVLAARGLAVSSEARARVEACQEVPTLERWLARALTAASAEQLLAEPAKRS